MSLKKWEQKVLEAPGAAERVAEIEDELRLAAGLTALREQAGLSQRELADRLGVKQPRVAAIEKARNVTIDVLDRYVGALGGQLQVSVLKGGRTIPLLGASNKGRTKRQPDALPTPSKNGAKTPKRAG
jgi:transcriptional regulator with XRE-family HTH domain